MPLKTKPTDDYATATASAALCHSTPSVASSLRKEAPFRVALGIDEAAKSLGVSRSGLYNWIAEGRIRTIRIAQRRLITMAEIERILAGGAANAE